ncbi:mannonate dehydratase [Klebsiella pneumoniae]|nr:mannonate dehydratase [Klebsiella pneumoniae]
MTTDSTAIFRPDHGRFIWGEPDGRAISAFDRALIVTYLEGLWEALSKR